ncbi:ATP-binding cassette domain-containing protein [Coriobacteriia bacterium Es71-Z0120]|uniref:ABC transporter ATP-binding protein n=1 Tax=Parvivirga hydrogeniphila TaxID=2939460 RepID=UPI002260F496|nr:ABC transporter ATP-binding protein [Parvivirga hydrogeniphila]MCL4079456.1 ATP-binding cassette domain-containing protein [Parvivirga hydrogeniphila]
MSDRGAYVTAEGVGFTYTRARSAAIAGIDFVATPGSENWITGPNAAGKSTLLGVIAGVVPTVIEGNLTGRLDVVGAGTGGAATTSMVLQDSDVYLFRSVFDEIAFPLANRGVSGDELDSAVLGALEAVGIAHLESRLMHTLSGGERQKVAVAAALAVDPDVLLLDEPFEQLDPASAVEVLGLARRQSALGTTVFIATREAGHVPEGANRLHLVGGVPHVDDAEPRIVCWPKARPLGGLLLELRNLTHRYGSGGGVEDVDLSVHEGESVALLGPNGAGKTTIMKHACGLLRPDSGEVRVLDQDASDQQVWDLARVVGTLFQNPDDQIFNRLVEMEVAWSLIARGTAKEAALERAHAVMAELGISRLAMENPHEITASERQLVAFASVLVAEPRLIVLDEPTKALDADAAETVASAIERRLDDGAGVLLVTHDVRFAARLSNRCVVLADGRVIANGPSCEVLEDASLLRRARLLT